MRLPFSFFLFLFLLMFRNGLRAQNGSDYSLPVRAFCIAAPKPAGLDSFLVFIRQELVPREVNTLVLRVDYNYQYKSHPELRDSVALSKEEVGKLVALCRSYQIRVIPQINLLGHQSWASRPDNLLRVYPQFDETPWVQMPAHYEWPNADSLYCKSYCPLHPDLHKIVFDLVDELCDAFDADAFHAGMDEVFYLGEDRCPRCHGQDKAKLFADEVTRIHDHLASRGRELWIWGDRLLDGRSTGLGMWEASYNHTEAAIDLIPKDVVICDWHYVRPDPTAAYFAVKGFRVITCPWRNPSVGLMQVKALRDFRAGSTAQMRSRFLGIMQTVWSDCAHFLQGFYLDSRDTQGGDQTPWACFRQVMLAMQPPQPGHGE